MKNTLNYQLIGGGTSSWFSREYYESSQLILPRLSSASVSNLVYDWDYQLPQLRERRVTFTLRITKWHVIRG